MDITIAIPTYNGENRLPLVLDRLRSQIKTEEIAWEVIIIDNNSRDETGKIVQQYQKDWGNLVSLEYFFEAQQGLAFARERAIQEAKGDLIGFLDDDNIPALDWVYHAVQFAREHPQAGAYGGQIHADFEIDPPLNIDKIIGFFAIRERGEIPNQYRPEVISLPPGAGLVVRRKVWQDCFSQSSSFVGRVGNSMLSGEDAEVLLYMYKQGWEIWYNPNMHLDHKIPAKRLEKEYLLALIHGSCLPLFPLKMIVAKNWEKPAIAFKTVFGNLYNALKYKIKYREQLQQDNIISQCELQIYVSRIASFFYYLNQKLKPVKKLF
ncbi:hormogonium polysaccharide biosynthesis glycosyltransferase HpsE [Spirulina sp. 06S082]|uniref:hormogonium polysaccharide biosynthesis glycosyltransferase HpsE n=1 Tax=Spirulina sp. 06S082 TaxID=3110248 RepID=UPI002B1FC05F|nr:hormogonium polysaccharide biosynthesis glycosyltransferase HpsE [Spirulina sp. 06S082]MEA5468764.1 hormogonium polysaccharide biosynthesis glycosyltransferase HpsE [Spirulina sp. 06S082]